METEGRRKSYGRQVKIAAVSVIVNRGHAVAEAAQDLGIDALYRTGGDGN